MVATSAPKKALASPLTSGLTTVRPDYWKPIFKPVSDRMLFSSVRVISAHRLRRRGLWPRPERPWYSSG